MAESETMKHSIIIIKSIVPVILLTAFLFSSNLSLANEPAKLDIKDENRGSGIISHGGKISQKKLYQRSRYLHKVTKNFSKILHKVGFHKDPYIFNRKNYFIYYAPIIKRNILYGIIRTSVDIYPKNNPQSTLKELFPLSAGKRYTLKTEGYNSRGDYGEWHHDIKVNKEISVNIKNYGKIYCFDLHIYSWAIADGFKEDTFQIYCPLLGVSSKSIRENRREALAFQDRLKLFSADFDRLNKYLNSREKQPIIVSNLLEQFSF